MVSTTSRLKATFTGQPGNVHTKNGLAAGVVESGITFAEGWPRSIAEAKLPLRTIDDYCNADRMAGDSGNPDRLRQLDGDARRDLSRAPRILPASQQDLPASAAA